MDTTLDGLLNRRVMIEQPAQGFRVAIDTVFLAAAVPARAGERIADFGCGVGGALLCLACRVPDIYVMGIEVQPEMVELCERNIARNPFQADMQVLSGDVASALSEFDDVFDHVMMNPPYHDDERHDVSAQASKRKANSSREGDLQGWIESAVSVLKPAGVLTLIHRADRLDEIIECVSGVFAVVEIIRLVPKQGLPAKRVIVRAYRDRKMVGCPPRDFILHKPEGGYSDEAEQILRAAASL